MDKREVVKKLRFLSRKEDKSRAFSDLPSDATRPLAKRQRRNGIYLLANVLFSNPFPGRNERCVHLATDKTGRFFPRARAKSTGKTVARRRRHLARRKKKTKKGKKTRAFATCLRGGLLTLLFEVRAGAAKFAT